MYVSNFLINNIESHQRVRVIECLPHMQSVIFEGAFEYVNINNLKNYIINSIVFYTEENHDVDEDIIVIHCYEKLKEDSQDEE